MFKFNLITGPLFAAGLFNGFNKRAEPDFQHDPRAHYKLMGITVGMTTIGAINTYFKEQQPLMKSRLSSHIIAGGIVGGFLVSGTAYCMGLLLTKIPSKKAFE
jgi:hypothetical protein